MHEGNALPNKLIRLVEMTMFQLPSEWKEDLDMEIPHQQLFSTLF